MSGEAERGEVESFEPLLKAENTLRPYWWLVKLKDRPERFALHDNWVGLYGELKPGDKVEYIVSKALLYHRGPELLFDKLRKVEERKESLEAEAGL